MHNWEELAEVDHKLVWDWFYKKFSFKPSTQPRDWPGIKTNKPYLKIDITNLWGKEFNQIIWDDFLQKAIEAFTTIVNSNEKLFAIDWQHPCYYVDPRELTPAILNDYESSIPVVSFIPDGDYYIFITKDFENVWFGHPWEKTVTIIGSRLIDAFNKNPPIFLQNTKG